MPAKPKRPASKRVNGKTPCQLNKAELETLAAILKRHGYDPVGELIRLSRSEFFLSDEELRGDFGASLLGDFMPVKLTKPTKDGKTWHLTPRIGTQAKIATEITGYTHPKKRSVESQTKNDYTININVRQFAYDEKAGDVIEIGEDGRKITLPEDEL